VEVLAEVAEQTRLADELGYAIAWFAEHHFSNYCLCASPLMMVAHCAPITKKIRLGTAVVVSPLYNPARLAAEIATADALSNGRLMLGVGAGYQPYEFERFGVDIKANLEMTEEFCDILDHTFSQDFFSYTGKHYQIPETHIPARPVQKPLPIYVAGHTEAMFRSAARHGYRVLSSGRVGGAASWPSSTKWLRTPLRPRACRSPTPTSPSTASATSPTARRRAALRRKRALPEPPCIELTTATGGHAGKGAARQAVPRRTPARTDPPRSADRRCRDRG
jgi:alkanesulfonate monooxygenase SsuD/methylene tetrahydromethanopterin reductase-like flavin-dependent oxidoreductase (luciferase family)